MKVKKISKQYCSIQNEINLWNIKAYLGNEELEYGLVEVIHAYNIFEVIVFKGLNSLVAIIFLQASI